MRVGRDQFEVDPARQQRDDRRFEQGRGLIGGDPSRWPPHQRPRPIPEDQPYFRLIDISLEKRARLNRFLDHRPLEIEIGFGSGEFLLGRAAANPNRHFLGFEVKRDLCRQVVRALEEQELSNVWICDDDVRWALPRLDLVGRVDVIHVLYPDPWWKRKHHAKRLFRPPFVQLIHELLVPGGVLHVRSDVEGYAAYIEELVAEHGGFSPNQPELTAPFNQDPPTRREAFCRSIQRPFWVMAFRKLGSSGRAIGT